MEYGLKFLSELPFIYFDPWLTLVDSLFSFIYFSIRASVKAIKLDSTPLPVLADASNTLIPVLLENSSISSSLTYLNG